LPVFAYTARNARRERVEGLVEGADSRAVAGQLSSDGLVPLSITPTSASASAQSATPWHSRLATAVTPLEVQLFSRQLHALLKAGVPLMRALAGLEESATSRAFAAVLAKLRGSLDSGRELSTALRQHPRVFSNFYVSMVQVGEMTGRLDGIFLRLFDYMEFDRAMRERVRNALRYPAFVLGTMAVALAVINFLVLPAFARVYGRIDADLPLLTRALFAVSGALVAYWPLMVLLVLAAVVLARAQLSSAAGRLRWDRLKLRLPVVGDILLKAALARFARSFALATNSGVPVLTALGVVAITVDNAHIAARIDGMGDSLGRGESILRAATQAGVFTPVVLQMIAVGEEAGELGSLMDEVAGMYEREVDYQLSTLSARIEPVLIVVLGVIVLLLALGVFLPVWGLGAAMLHPRNG
jgi:MSHA biogenesis protein MshG